jgi:hypothetical protein
MALILFFLGNRRSFTPYWNFIEKITVYNYRPQQGD